MKSKTANVGTVAKKKPNHNKAIAARDEAKRKNTTTLHFIKI
jgi:hypothetical protein